MYQLNLIINSAPRDLLEFIFFLTVGYTAALQGLFKELQHDYNIFFSNIFKLTINLRNGLLVERPYKSKSKYIAINYFNKNKIN